MNQKEVSERIRALLRGEDEECGIVANHDQFDRIMGRVLQQMKEDVPLMAKLKLTQPFVEVQIGVCGSSEELIRCVKAAGWTIPVAAESSIRNRSTFFASAVEDRKIGLFAASELGIYRTRPPEIEMVMQKGFDLGLKPCTTEMVGDSCLTATWNSRPFNGKVIVAGMDLVQVEAFDEQTLEIRRWVERKGELGMVSIHKSPDALYMFELPD